MFDKLKELSKDTAVYGISTIVSRFLNFLLVPFYTNVFATEVFGIYTAVYAYVAFLNIAYIYGMDAAFMKYAADSDGHDKKKVFSTAFITVTISSLLFSLLIILFRGNAASAIDLPGEYSHVLFYVAFVLLFDTLALIPFGALRLERKSVKFAVIKTLNIVIQIALNVILILGYKMGIEAIFISNLAGSAFSLVALLPEIGRRLEISVNRELLNKLFRFGIPYLPASIASMMVQVIDVPIMHSLTNYATVGIYKANYKLGIFMMLFVSMFQYAWQPFFLTNAKNPEAKNIFAKVLTLFTLVTAAIWVTLSLFIENIASFEIIGGRTLIGPDYLGGVMIVPIVLFGYFFYGMYVNFQAGIYIEEKTKYFPYVTGAGAAANIIANFLLIPVIGIYGAALATLASYIVMAAGLYLFAQKFYPVNYEKGKIILIIVLMVITGIVYYYLWFEGALNLMWKFVLLVSFFISLFITGVVKISELKSTFNHLLKKS